MAVKVWVEAVLEKCRAQEDARRVYHGRGGLHGEGPVDLALEWYPPVLLAMVYSVEAKKELLGVLGAMENETSIESLVIQDRSEKGPPTWTVCFGDVPEQHLAREDGLVYRIGFLGRQNPGLFLASREARRWVRKNSNGLNVLNLFAFTGAFGVVALKGGAEGLAQLDMKRGPLMEGKDNLFLNGCSASGVEFWAHDLLSSKGKVRKKGPWELVILDPPTFQKGAWNLQNDLPKIIRALPDWTKTGSKVMLCIHDPAVSFEQARSWMEGEGLPWKFLEKLDLPEGFEEKDPDQGLKVLIFQKI